MNLGKKKKKKKKKKALFLGEKPQHVYSVRFAARELWGEQASPRDSVDIDMRDNYLEPA